jgi:cytochrome c biogenesis protein CcmG, thiol:disulfide interchange protein DsbE
VKHPARVVALAVALVVVVLGVVLALNVGSDPEQDAKQSHLVGKAAPAFDLPNLGGGKVTLADTAGKATIVNFWNTWCIPCQQEAPVLQKFYAEHANDSDFAMVGIVRGDETSTVKAYVRKHGVGWTIALDPQNQAALDFATRGQPETYAISPSGVVTAAKYGPMSSSDLETFLASARASG